MGRRRGGGGGDGGVGAADVAGAVDQDFGPVGQAVVARLVAAVVVGREGSRKSVVAAGSGRTGCLLCRCLELSY